MPHAGVRPCSSRHLRLTHSTFPNSAVLMSRWNLPMGVVAHPFAESPTEALGRYLAIVVSVY